MAGLAIAIGAGAESWRSAGDADSRGAAPVGNRPSIGGNSVGNDAAIGAGFSPREPGRTAQQYSGGDPDRNHRATGFSCAAAHVRLDAAGDGGRTRGWILRWLAAGDRELVRPSAAAFLPHSRP